MDGLFYEAWWACRGDETAKRVLAETLEVTLNSMVRSTLRKKGIAREEDFEDAEHDVVTRVYERIE